MAVPEYGVGRVLHSDSCQGLEDGRVRSGVSEWGSLGLLGSQEGSGRGLLHPCRSLELPPTWPPLGHTEISLTFSSGVMGTPRAVLKWGWGRVM